MKNNNIQLIATDLDGTLLNHQLNLSQENKIALEQAADMEIITVIATGRSFLSIPDYVKEINGLKYAVSSNGAKIHDLKTGEQIFGQYINESSINALDDILRKNNIMLEVFVNGVPYVHNWSYFNPHIYGTSESYIKYFMASRKPVEDIYSFIETNKNKIENINLVFSSPHDRLQTLSELEDVQRINKDFNLTSSFPFNLEIGGFNVDKATAIEKICELHNIKSENVMCVGDNHNDLSMVEFAGVGVAVEDAVPEVREAAQFVTKSSSESGVAFAVNKYVL